MLHDRRQRHRKGLGKLTDRQVVLLAQPGKQCPARWIGQRCKRAIEIGFAIVNHLVKYRTGPAAVKKPRHLFFVEEGTVKLSWMDPLSLATALTAAQMGRAQMALAAKMLRMNVDAAASIVQVIDAAQENIANLSNVAAGVGRNLNLTA